MSCPRDTNGDGDCGQPLCPDCGTHPQAEHSRKIQADLPHATDEALWPDAREAARDEAGQ